MPVDPTLEGPSVAASRFDERGAWSDPPTPFTELVEQPPRRRRAWPQRCTPQCVTCPEPQQAVVTLRDVQGLSTYEVSALLGLTEGNVRVILHRGRAKVREALEGLVRGGER